MNSNTAHTIALLVIGANIGVLIMFVAFNYVLNRNEKSKNNYWRDICLNINDQWSQFHKDSIVKWEQQTKVLMEQAAYEAALERDKQWRLAQAGTPQSKPKPPTN